MMEKSKLERIRALKINKSRWLTLCNLIVMVSSFTGMILAFSLMNSIAITAFGLAFLASLSIEVLRNDSKLKRKNK